MIDYRNVARLLPKKGANAWKIFDLEVFRTGSKRGVTKHLTWERKTEIKRS